MQILDDFLTRIANAIRKRKQTTDLIKANNFASEIESIPQTYVSSLQEKSVTITTNGTTTVSPDSDYDGLSNAVITTNVQPALQSKSTTLTSSSAISIVPDSGYYGLSKVTVTPSVQTKSQTITSNGTTTISPDSGKVGLSKVTVTTNIPTLNSITTGYHNLGSNNISSSSLTKSFTVPAASTQAYFYVISSTEGHYTNYGDGVSGTSAAGSCKTTTGTISRDLYTTFSGGMNANLTFLFRRWKLTKSVGTAATVTFYGQNAYGGCTETIIMCTN